MDAASRPALEPGRRARLVLGLAAAVPLALAVLAGGGSDAVPLGVASAAFAGAGLAGALALSGRLPVPVLDRSGRLVVAGAVAVTGWVGLSILWSIAGDQSWEWLDRGLVLLAFLALGLLVGAVRGALGPLAHVLTAVIGAALAWALLGVVVPSLAPDGDRVARLREPIGYWNALALLADVGIVLGLRLAVTPRRLTRVAGVVLVFGAVVVLLLTQSRAGVFGAVAVLALALVREPRRVEAALLGLLGAVPGLAVAGWAFTRSALVDDGAGRAARVDDGRLFAVALALGAAVAICAAALVPVERLAHDRRRAMGRGLVVIALALVVVGLVALTASVGNPVRWASDQMTGGECANDPGRLTALCANNRLAWWGEALRIAADHPLGGTGAGTFSIARLRVRDDATPVTEPHSVPLQLLADLGVVGLGLGLLVAVAAAVGLRSALRRRDAVAAWDGTALAALPLAWSVHALIDYDLDFVAVSGPALLAVGALLAAGRPVRAVRAGAAGLVAVAAVVLAAVASVALPVLAQRAVDEVYSTTDLQTAADAARRARSLDPLSLDPVFAQAYVAEQAGDRARAQALLEEATRMQPENPDSWLELARFHYTADPPDYCAAYEAFNEAYTRDPMSSRWVSGGPLDVSRDEVNAGACEPSP